MTILTIDYYSRMYQYAPHVKIVLLVLESPMSNMNAILFVQMPFFFDVKLKIGSKFAKEFSYNNFGIFEYNLTYGNVRVD